MQAVVDAVLAEPLMETSPKSLRTANYLMSEALNTGVGLDTYVTLQKLLVQRAFELATREAYLAAEYQSAAVAMTYNLAANTWAGWGPDEIPLVSEAHARLGLEAARTNVRLAEDLGLGPERRKNGYWILGAQLLAAGEFDGAVKAFATSRDLADEAGDEVAATAADGWIHLTNTVAGEDETLGLEAVQDSLRGKGKEGAFYADQYDAALEVFSR